MRLLLDTQQPEHHLDHCLLGAPHCTHAHTHTHTHTLNKNKMAYIHQTHMCMAEGGLREFVYLWSQCRMLLF